MAANVSVIGRTTRVHGRVTGAVDLEVQGFVEGEIAVSGDVTVDANGIVGAGVRGRRLVIRGAIKGDLVGEEGVSLEEGARVVGDVRAPRVSIAPGALLRGFVETGEANGAAARAGRSTQGVPRPQPVAHPVAPNVAKAARPTTARTAAATAEAAPVASSSKSSPRQVGAASKSNGPAGRRPPPPVVPALKKAKGQIAKRKER